MRSILLTALLLLPSITYGGIVERTRITDPVLSLIPANPSAVAVSGNGMFLVNGQRITADGTKLDPAGPIDGASGYPVGWSEGWILLQSREDRYVLRHLHENASLETFREINRVAGSYIVSATSNADHVLLIEISYANNLVDASAISISATEMKRTKLGPRRAAVAAPSESGFLLLTWTQDESSDPPRGALHAFRLGIDGVPEAEREIGSSPFPYEMQAASDGSRMAVVQRTDPATLRVIGPSLDASTPVTVGPPTSYPESLFLIGVNGGFLLSYGWGYPRETRTLVVNSAGALISDSVDDPIRSGARYGSKYLITRPWGEAAISQGDPRTVISAAIPLFERQLTGYTNYLPVISGDVVLVALGNFASYTHFRRIHADGTKIDQTDITIPTPGLYAPPSVVAIPEGFAFLWDEGARVVMRRLSRSGSWIDSSARTVIQDRGDSYSNSSAHANGSDVLIAWATSLGASWQRVSFDGSTIGSRGSAPPRSDDFDLEWYRVSIAGKGTDRLLLLEGSEPCYILCPHLRPHLSAAVVDGSGGSAGVSESFEGENDSKAAGLEDGSWIVALPGGNPRVARLAHDGTTISVDAVPALGPYAFDVTATPAGWRAIAGLPLALVEMSATSQTIAVTGLSTLSGAKFAGSDLVFGRTSDYTGPSVSYGSVAAADGSVSVSTSILSGPATRRLADVTIRNDSAFPLTNAALAVQYPLVLARTGDSSGLLAPLAPGESQVIPILLTSSWAVTPRYVSVVSDDVRDTSPEDNIVSLSLSAPQGTRRRTTR